MKRLWRRMVIALTAVLCLAWAAPVCAADGRTAITTQREMRAVWVASVLNIDFPKTQDNAEAQKAEIRVILDHAVLWGFNTVIMQVCPTADALYRSKINPWSAVLTGTQGKDPGYDPLAYMVEEAHVRGLALHAWVNPYRVTHSTLQMKLSDLAENHPARLHPDWVIEYEGGIYYNPEIGEVKQLIADTAVEIVRNYDVDGIHFDDYFYPSGYPLPEGEERDGAADEQRRQNVNDMIRTVRDAVKQANPEVEFGISPFGIWKNSSSDPAGSDTAGNEAYYSMSCDAAAWVEDGLVDYIVPQVYWEIGHEAADYETLVAWWAALVRGSNVALYIGQGIYKDEVAVEIHKQLAVNEKYSRVNGNVYFSYSDLLENRQGCADQIAAYYAEHPLGNKPFFDHFSGAPGKPAA